jgi:hypothetical protein
MDPHPWYEFWKSWSPGAQDAVGGGIAGSVATGAGMLTKRFIQRVHKKIKDRPRKGESSENEMYKNRWRKRW